MKLAAMIAILTTLLVTFSSPLIAQVYFNDGGVHIVSGQSGDYYVDYQSPEMHTTVNMYLVNVGVLHTYGSSQVSMNKGWYFNGTFYDDPIYTCSVSYSLNTYDNSQVTINWGWIRSADLNLYDNSCLIINELVTWPGYESNPSLKLYGNSRFIQNGGAFQWGSWAYENSQVTINNGSGKWFVAYGNSAVTMNGGSYENALFTLDGKLFMNGGFSQLIGIEGNGQAVIKGGHVNILTFGTNSKAMVYGSDFAVDGIPFGYGEIKTLLGGSRNDEPNRILTGILANGDILNCQIQIGETSSIVLAPVPEPSSLLALGGGLAWLIGTRRKRK